MTTAMETKMKTTAAGSRLLQDKHREIAIIAGLVTMGEKGRRHFASHVHAALDAGARRQEIVEVIATLSQVSGTPTAVNGIAAATKVFDNRDASGTRSRVKRNSHQAMPRYPKGTPRAC